MLQLYKSKAWHCKTVGETDNWKVEFKVKILKAIQAIRSKCYTLKNA